MSKVWLIDIDGTVCEDIPNETPELFVTAKPLVGALDKVKEMEKTGEIWFFTARTNEHSEATEAWLDKHGFPYQGVTYNKPRIKQGQTYHWVDNRPVMASYTPRGIEELVTPEVEVSYEYT
jgi:hypothetical protein